jgi:hypothetical protein
MDTLFGIGIIAVAGYFLYKWFIKETKKPEEPEIKVEPAKKIESDFVTGLSVAKEEVKVEVAKVETAVVEEAKEAAAELTKKVETIVEPIPALLVQHGDHSVEPVVAEVKKKVRTVKAKAKAIEAVVEAKVEKIEQAVVKKTRAKTTKAKK